MADGYEIVQGVRNVAGHSSTITLPRTGPGKVLLIPQVSFRCRTGATVANRVPYMEVRSQSGDVLSRVESAAVQAASLTLRYSWGVADYVAVAAGGTSINLGAGLMLAMTSEYQIVAGMVNDQTNDDVLDLIATMIEKDIREL